MVRFVVDSSAQINTYVTDASRSISIKVKPRAAVVLYQPDVDFLIVLGGILSALGLILL